ncbi:phosphatidylethanolamine N-methyltransferase isoform X2 [Moschus berezovskii]|uniref:phosphatidylethanolamine N-methyltransferase isoform X2 n=1 Tax=Moschus berezovskii TaxID=68408 RepID=UPI002444AE84|nr:phosphatidylethanolamine N-methyltransferase isoform X2 [Moschus berezovskii]XP_055263451.1 phosphatidylethanolamine N-methyltransferase isoform X2 [Moschus berezovskii]
MTRLLGYVDLSEPHFVAAVLAIVFNPLFWNVLVCVQQDPNEVCTLCSVDIALGGHDSWALHFLPCHLLGEESRKMGTQDPKAEQSLRVPPPGLLHPGWGHPASERPAVALLHAGHAEPAPDAEPGQPRGLPRGPGAPGSGWRVRLLQFPGAGLHRDLPRRLLRDPQGGQSDHVPVQCPGQPHVLGQHGHLPGLGHRARQPHRPAADRGGGTHLHGRHPV